MLWRPYPLLYLSPYPLLCFTHPTTFTSHPTCYSCPLTLPPLTDYYSPLRYRGLKSSQDRHTDGQTVTQTWQKSRTLDNDIWHPKKTEWELFIIYFSLSGACHLAICEYLPSKGAGMNLKGRRCYQDESHDPNCHYDKYDIPWSEDLVCQFSPRKCTFTHPSMYLTLEMLTINRNGPWEQ